MENKFCSMHGFSSINIHFSFNRINEVYVFFTKYRYSDVHPRSDSTELAEAVPIAADREI